MIISNIKEGISQDGAFVLDNEVLYHFGEGSSKRREFKRKLVIPKVMQPEIMKQMHDDMLAGHLGMEKTYKRLYDRFWWNGMYSYCKQWIASCPDCQALKQPVGRRGFNKLPTLGMPVPSAPFELVGVDTIDKLPKTDRGNRNIVVFTDYLTKWVEAFAIPDSKAQTVADILVQHIIPRHGVPIQLLSDRGKAFIGEVGQSIYYLLGTNKLNTSAYHPQCNGLTERFNGTLVKMLAMYCNKNQNDWDVYLPFVLFAYRTAYHSSVGETPFYLLYGREPRLPIDVATKLDLEERYPTASAYTNTIKTRLSNAHKLVREYLQSVSDNRNQVGADYKTYYQPGDMVHVKFPQVKAGMKKKLTPLWRGPYVVIKKTGPKNYFVKLKGSNQGINRSLSMLKPYNDPTSMLSQHNQQHQTSESKNDIDTQAESKLDINEHEEYEVERIESHRINDKGEIEYHVKWKGYPQSRNTWEPESNLMNSNSILHAYKFQKRLLTVKHITNNPDISTTSHGPSTINEYVNTINYLVNSVFKYLSSDINEHNHNYSTNNKFHNNSRSTTDSESHSINLLNQIYKQL